MSVLNEKLAARLRLPLRSADDLHLAVTELGVLPFFRGSIRGFDVESLADPSLWFADDADGPWEWKGPVIGMGGCAYGKFLRGKAVYMRLDLYADFLNFRRSCLEPSTVPNERLGGLSEAELATIIGNCGSVLSSELKDMLGMGRHKRRTADDLVDLTGAGAVAGSTSAARTALDTMLMHLQMCGRICISGFEYPLSTHGKEYGWGLARYTTPEAIYGSTIATADGRTPVQSRERLFEAIATAVPSATPRQIHTLLG